MMSRFSWGYSRELMAQMRHAGRPDAWFEAQLKPTAISDHVCDRFNAWYPDRNQSAKVKYDRLHRSTAKTFPGLTYRPIGVMKN